jgi:hypothetical protein
MCASMCARHSHVCQAQCVQGTAYERLCLICMCSFFFSGTAYERLWLIYLLLNKEASGVEKLEVDHEHPSYVYIFMHRMGLTKYAYHIYIYTHIHIYVCIYVCVCVCVRVCVGGPRRSVQ